VRAELKAFPHLRLVIIKEPGNAGLGHDAVLTWRIFSRAGERLKGSRDTVIDALDAELEKRTKGVLRIACCVLRVACCVLRVR
jgi:hypothetical protein